MSKINADTLKEAARSAAGLLESSPPEVKLVLESPNFALGLCMVLHRELMEVKNELAELKQSHGHPRPPATQPAPAQPSQAPTENATPEQAPPQTERPPQTSGQSQAVASEATPEATPAPYGERRAQSQQTQVHAPTPMQFMPTGPGPVQAPPPVDAAPPTTPNRSQAPLPGQDPGHSEPVDDSRIPKEAEKPLFA
jgi:hypothetical protein